MPEGAAAWKADTRLSGKFGTRAKPLPDNPYQQPVLRPARPTRQKEETMMGEKVDLDDFRQAVIGSGGEFYGEYRGRSLFHGYAGTFSSAGDLIAFGAELEREGLSRLAYSVPHIDSLGTSVLAGYPARLFATPSNTEGK